MVKLVMDGNGDRGRDCSNASSPLISQRRSIVNIVSTITKAMFETMCFLCAILLKSACHHVQECMCDHPYSSGVHSYIHAYATMLRNACATIRRIAIFHITIIQTPIDGPCSS